VLSTSISFVVWWIIVSDDFVHQILISMIGCVKVYCTYAIDYERLSIILNLTIV
jgi:hypothetical protein